MRLHLPAIPPETRSLLHLLFTGRTQFLPPFFLLRSSGENVWLLQTNTHAHPPRFCASEASRALKTPAGEAKRHVTEPVH